MPDPDPRPLRRGDPIPDHRWFNWVRDRLLDLPFDVDASAGLTLAKVGSRWVLSYVAPAIVFPAIAGGTGADGATSGQMTSQTATLYVAGNDGAMSSLGRDVTYWHWGSAAVTAGARLLLLKVFGLWFVLWEDCDEA